MVVNGITRTNDDKLPTAKEGYNGFGNDDDDAVQFSLFTLHG